MNHAQRTSSTLLITTPLQRINLIYASYRILLSFFLIGLFLLTVTNPIVGINDPALYLQSVSTYCLATICGFLLLKLWPFYQDVQIFVMLVIDVTAMTLMLYANGGPSLQLSMLYLVMVMAASILLPQGRALIIGLLAAFAVIYQQFYFSLIRDNNLRMVSSVSLLAVSFIAISILGQLVTRRLRVVELEVFSQTKQALQLQEINQHIVEQMHTGVLVFDQEQRLMVINEAARQWLHQPNAVQGWTLTQLSLLLRHQINEALANQILTPFVLEANERNLALSVQLVPLDVGIVPRINERQMHDAPTIVILENLSRVNQKAQQMKLASLGRLTASIAHEIRNPLAAISQAGELLSEMVDHSDQRALLSMIQKQSSRMNRMIEDILQLSRRSTSRPQAIPLVEWVQEFIRNFIPNSTEKIQAQNFNSDQLYLEVQSTREDDHHIVFDPMQLEQVMTNLVNNGLHHGAKVHKKPRIYLRIKTLESGLVMLDVMDQGAGIPQNAMSSLFEPFFTTESGGTGLGLYVSRAFCEANGASLWCIPQAYGACFRISFGV
jgi:two-component system sensor histidine kinase PilS (NtrC family)